MIASVEVVNVADATAASTSEKDGRKVLPNPAESET